MATSDTTYNFTMRTDEDRDGSLVEPTSGTLETAIQLAKSFDAVILLTDEAGFARGRVERNGDYRLT